MEFRLTPEERARHAALSPLQADWLDFVAAHPELLERAAFPDFATDGDVEGQWVQPWPQLVDPALLAQVAGLGALFRLIKGVPLRIFDNDPERLAEFYGVTEPFARHAAALLADADGLERLIGRGDLLVGAGGAAGFACCEWNISGNLGGWEVGLWRERLLAIPQVAEFLAGRGLRVTSVTPLDALLEQLVEIGLARGFADDGELNVALILGRAFPDEMLARIDRRYAGALARSAGALRGNVLVCREPQLTWDGRRARLGGRPVQLFVDHVMEQLDGPVWRAHASGRGFVFNGVASPILSDKRNLALLSEQAADGDLYTPAERALVAGWVPWTRILTDGFTDRDGDRIYLPDFAREGRDRLVIKPASNFGGRDVFLGPALAPAEWEARLDAALADGRWVVQDFVPSEPYLFQAREGGAVLHDIVWGAFFCGGRYASSFLRGAPVGAGIVNVAQGARYIVPLEVEGSAPGPDPIREPSCHEESRDAL